ncbi:hypothetical protein T484DRAFT_1809576 [Baffinella frigidus]|nr:hypothetical protein T484DRAFT_1809576 [Cryptophyta sp. CCMP2293]
MEKANLKAVIFPADKTGKLPKRIALVATCKIFKDDELLYDYGDGTKPTACLTACACGAEKCKKWVR